MHHRIEVQIDYFPMSRANGALARLAAGKARYRIVLENDLAQAGAGIQAAVEQRRRRWSCCEARDHAACG